MNWLYSDSPVQLRKLFIGGLAYDVTEDMLSHHFSHYGQLVDSTVMRDTVTGISRGFGFVIFATIVGAEVAMAVKPHMINGSRVDVKRAIPKSQMATITTPRDFNHNALPGCKLLLSGVQKRVNTVDSFRIYFEAYGVVEQIEILHRPHASFGFVIFEKKTSADQVLGDNNGHHVIDGVMIMVSDFPKKWNRNSPPMMMRSPDTSDSGTVEDATLEPTIEADERTIEADEPAFEDDEATIETDEPVIEADELTIEADSIRVEDDIA